MTVTFVDAGVLISAARGEGDIARRAFEILDDPSRIFASSDFVKLEIMPKPKYFKKSDEVNFYDEFFSGVSIWASGDIELVRAAFAEGERYGLSALDSLHVAAALKIGANEFVTNEKKDSAIHRFKAIPVITIRT